MLLLDLYASLRQLDSLTGETTADDILEPDLLYLLHRKIE